MQCRHMICHQCEAPTQKYTFRGGYIEDESGDRWWSAGLVALLERERDEALAHIEKLEASLRHVQEGAARVAVRHGNITTAEIIRTLCTDCGWPKKSPPCRSRHG